MHIPISLPLLLSLLLTSHTLAATLHLAGDSTTAKWPSNSFKQGWGTYFSSYTTLTINNQAISGSSARSYTREGHFQALAARVQPGDFVVMEYGHNDGGGVSNLGNGRTACPVEICHYTYNGITETIHSYEYYLIQAAKLFQSRGATVIISSQTPNNVYESGSFAYSDTRFVVLARKAAAEAGVAFVDHGKFVAGLYQGLGRETVDGFYRREDHTHTNADGARVVAKAFSLAVKASSSPLRSYMM